MLLPCSVHYQYREDCHACRSKNFQQESNSSYEPSAVSDSTSFASALAPDPTPNTDFSGFDGGSSGGGGASSDF